MARRRKNSGSVLNPFNLIIMVISAIIGIALAFVVTMINFIKKC